MFLQIDNRMRWRVLALISVVVNLALAAGWFLYSRQAGGAGETTPAVAGATNSTRPIILVRRQFVSWQELESTNYVTYIANLRDIGCPEQTIRDIIIADVNATFARMRDTELVTPGQQWWRSEPDTNVVLAAAQKLRALEEQRRVLLTSLLGNSWESGDLVSLPRPTRRAIVLDGPVLGPLPADVKQALQEINARSGEKMQAYLEAQRAAGKPADPVEVARLRQQTRTELASVLAPAQLEEFLLRYSQYGNDLRTEFGQLKYFKPTSDEFRAVFRATDALDQQIQLLADATDANSVQTRQSLEAQRENAIKGALGARRYEQYRLLHDPLYRDAVASAEQYGTPDAVQTLYQINLAAAAEQSSILGDASLTPEQKNIALKSAQLDQLKASAVASGQELPPEPPAPEPAPAPPPRRTYTLRSGDTVSVVALIYGVPESAIRAANPGVNFNRLRPGDSLYIPRSALPASTGPQR
jgi:LysM repeat protein